MTLAKLIIDIIFSIF